MVCRCSKCNSSTCETCKKWMELYRNISRLGERNLSIFDFCGGGLGGGEVLGGELKPHGNHKWLDMHLNTYVTVEVGKL